MTSRDGGRSHFLSGSFLTVTLTDCGPDESAAITAVATASQSESSSAVSVRKREELPCESLHGELDYCQLSGKLFHAFTHLRRGTKLEVKPFSS